VFFDFMLRFAFRDAQLEASLVERGYEIIEPGLSRRRNWPLDAQSFQIVLVEPREEDAASLVRIAEERLGSLRTLLESLTRTDGLDLDIGVSLDDDAFSQSVRFPPDFLRLLHDLHVNLEVSVY
jgi:hypothetical protein